MYKVFNTQIMKINKNKFIYKLHVHNIKEIANTK